MVQSFVAIIGSVDPSRAFEPPVANVQDAAGASYQLGMELGKAGLGIIVYSNNPAYIEGDVVKGYLESGKAEKESIRVFYPDQTTDYQFEGYERYKDRFDLYPSHHENWEVSFYHSIHGVDGLVLLGGGSSTHIAGMMAIPARTPLIAISHFGGSAFTIRRLLSEPNHLATEEEILLMGQPWNSWSAQGLVACLKRQIERRQQMDRYARAKDVIPTNSKDGVRIAWLSDIHFAEEQDRLYLKSRLRRWRAGLWHIRGNVIAQNFARQNLETVFQHLEDVRPDHILLTGDLTNKAQEKQFAKVKEQCLLLQGNLWPNENKKKLAPTRWTILPGNHDVTLTQRAQGVQRRNLGLFFKHFEEIYELNQSNYDECFPLCRSLPRKTASGMKVSIFGLDSTCRYPVNWVGVNARGRIDQDQLDRLSKGLSKVSPNEVVLVALHHHPIVVPKVGSNLETYFLSMNESDGRDLVTLCANQRVSAILHGHYHAFSCWSSMSEDCTREMAVIGSPSGTLNPPGVDVKYLEMREAIRESRWGTRQGLAVYLVYLEAGTWKDKYLYFVEGSTVPPQ